MTRCALLCGSLATMFVMATGAVAQEGEPLPLLTPGTLDVITPDAPAPEPAAAAPAPQPAPSPEETLDEAAEAIVQLLTADTSEGPPMAECAIDLLRTRLATAVEGDDVLTAIALENELLSLCNRRQQLVLEVLSTELLLASMVVGETLRETAPRAAVIVPEAPEPPAAASLDQLVAVAPPPPPEPAAEPEPAPLPPSSPGLSWVTVLGSAGNLRAAVTDGTSVWWVREDDALAGGWRVTRIAARPPGVTLSHAEAGHHALPFHSGPAAGAQQP